MSANFSYGHSHLFWELVLRSIEDSEILSEEERVITIISPWLRDIIVSSSNIPTEDFRDFLGGFTGPLSNLSDVLLAMKSELNFTINILTLDSVDPVLPKNERSWLDQESTMIDKLVGLDRTNPNINVLKQLGVHAKMYIFPSAALSGSVNLTNAGMFLNGENLTLTDKVKDSESFRQICINGQYKLQGAISYYDGTRVDMNTQIIPTEIPTERPLTGIEPIRSTFPNPSSNAEAYIFPPVIQMGGISNNGDFFLSDTEQFELHKWCFWFEKEMRSVVKHYFHEFANRMADWSDTDLGDGTLEEMWHHLLIVKSHGASFHESAIKTYKMSRRRESDFPLGEAPDVSNFKPDEALIYGSVINDLWTCIYGSENKPFHDHGGNRLLEKSLYFFTTQMLGLPPKQTNEEKVKKFWYQLEDYFWAIAWVRNRHGHVDQIPRERAIECQTGLLKFNQRVLKPFSQYISN